MPSSNLSPSPSPFSHLEQTRLSYLSLSRRLFSLPHRLTHPALIPVAPRLYLSGQVIDTNHITVLLGSSNDHPWYAERSAFQARGIVQRRLAAIDDKISNLSLDNTPVQHPRNSNPNSPHPAPNQPATSTSLTPTSPPTFGPINPHPLTSGPHQTPRLSTLHPTAAHNLDNKVPLPNLHPNPPITTHTSQSTVMPHPSPLSAPVHSTRANVHSPHSPPHPHQRPDQQSDEIQQQPNAKAGETDIQDVPSVEVDVGDGTVRKLGKRVSFREPIVTRVGVAASYGTRKRPPVQSALAAAVAQARAEHEKLLREGKVMEAVESDDEDLEADDGGAPDQSEGDKMKGEWNTVVENAQRQMREGGVVNLVEVYEGDGDEPSRVEMGDGFVPDEGVAWEDGSEDFLDLTGGRAGPVMASTANSVMKSSASLESSKADEISGGGLDSTSDDTLVRNDFMRELLEMEREEEEKKERKEKKKEKAAVETKRKEEKEFGKGFSRGFFNSGGSSGKKKLKPGAAISSTKFVSGDEGKTTKTLEDGGSEMESLKTVHDNEEVQTESVGTGGASAAVEERVIERVVERRGNRSGRGHGRKTHKFRAGNLKQIEVRTAADRWGQTESGMVEEGEGGESGPVVSKFRQMRQRQRLGSKGQVGRTAQ